MPTEKDRMRGNAWRQTTLPVRISLTLILAKGCTKVNRA